MTKVPQGSDNSSEQLPAAQDGDRFRVGDKVTIPGVDDVIAVVVAAADALGRLRLVDSTTGQEHAAHESRVVPYVGEAPSGPTREQVMVRAIADGLNQLADMIRNRPDLADTLRNTQLHGSRPITVPVGGEEEGEARARIVAFAAAALAAGAKVTEEWDGYNGGVVAMFGPVRVKAHAPIPDLTDTPSPPRLARRPLLDDVPLSAEEWGESELDQDRNPTAEGYVEYLAARVIGDTPDGAS